MFLPNSPFLCIWNVQLLFIFWLYLFVIFKTLILVLKQNIHFLCCWICLNAFLPPHLSCELILFFLKCIFMFSLSLPFLISWFLTMWPLWPDPIPFSPSCSSSRSSRRWRKRRAPARATAQSVVVAEAEVVGGALVQGEGEGQGALCPPHQALPPPRRHRSPHAPRSRTRQPPTSMLSHQVSGHQGGTLAGRGFFHPFLSSDWGGGRERGGKAFYFMVLASLSFLFLFRGTSLGVLAYLGFVSPAKGWSMIWFWCNRCV